MNVFVKKTLQSKISHQFSISENTSSRSSSESTKNVQTFNEFNFIFNEFDFMFNEHVSSSTKTFVAIEISEKNKKTINFSRKNQLMNKKVNISSQRKILFVQKSRKCRKIS